MMIQRIVHRSGRILLTAIMACVGMSEPTHAQQSAKDYFEPIVSHHQFTMLVRDLDLQRDQRLIVEMVFADYLDALESLAAEADARADQVGRRTVNDALAGRAIVEPAELRRLRLAVLEVYESSFEHVDREFDKLTIGLRGVLTAEQRPLLDPGIRKLRRTVLLHPRHVERNFHEYAGDGVDVLLLVQEAAAPGNELHEIHGATPVGWRESPLAPILNRYERELDQFLIETATAHRIARMKLRKARITRDSIEVREAEREVIELWERLYTLNSRTVNEIADMLPPEARQRWLHRFDEACFAWMFTKSLPDRQHEWLMRQNLSPQQRQDVQEVYEEYLARRFVLSGRAIAMILQARAEHHSIVHPMMEPGFSGPTRRLYDELLRNSGEMATLDAHASTEFEKLLSDSQRAAFRSTFRRR